jgi:hypothetical protein
MLLERSLFRDLISALLFRTKSESKLKSRAMHDTLDFSLSSVLLGVLCRCLVSCWLGYKKLAVEALELGVSLYAFKPKLHYFEHLCDTVLEERINPSWYWNFGEEDLMGTVIDLGCKTHRSTVAARILDRYWIRLALAFAGRGASPVGPPAWW